MFIYPGPDCSSNGLELLLEGFKGERGSNCCATLNSLPLTFGHMTNDEETEVLPVGTHTTQIDSDGTINKAVGKIGP